MHPLPNNKNWDYGGCVCAAFYRRLHKKTLDISMFFYNLGLAFSFEFIYNKTLRYVD